MLGEEMAVIHAVQLMLAQRVAILFQIINLQML